MQVIIIGRAQTSDSRSSCHGVSSLANKTAYNVFYQKSNATSDSFFQAFKSPIFSEATHLIR